MQLREIPLTAVAEDSDELKEEAEWIYKQAFVKATVSTQQPTTERNNRKPASTVNKIKQALDFMRNQQLEVPFIAFYRKEYVQPELTINDLWRVYNYDALWCQLLSRKRNLIKLFEKMRNFQLDELMKDPDSAIPDNVRLIKDDDIDAVKNAQTVEELKDVHLHFLLHYAHEIPAMQEAWKLKEKDRRRAARMAARRKQLENLEEGAEVPEEEPDDEDDEPQDEPLKYARDSGPYAMCRKAGILSFAKRFGLTPEQFAENLRDNYQKHDVEQEPVEPSEIAKEYISPKFSTEDEVLHAVKFVVARQLSREPVLRKSVREIFFERAKISVAPTKKGSKEIDEHHPLYTMKYLKNKPVGDLEYEQFLRLFMGEDDKIITLTISETIEGNTCSNYLEEVKQFYQRDEFSKNVQDWNKLRAECVEEAINKMVLPDMRKELKSILLSEAKEFVLKACARKMHNWIKSAPYSVQFNDEDDDEWDTSKGVRILGISYEDDNKQAAFGALLAPDGEVSNFMRLPSILKRKNSHFENEKHAKLADLLAMKNFLRSKKPHVVAVSGASFLASKIQEDIRGVIKELVDDEQFPNIAVEIVDNDLAKIYANSKKGNADFREYPDVLRQAISIARRLQDPLVEFSQLCTSDEEILCLRFHTLQDQLSKEELLEAIYLEFINRTNEVGIDINLVVQNSLTQNLVQFISGLGPRKGAALIKILKQNNQRLENRTQLVTVCHMGPKGFINCSGFIKIDTNSLGDSTEAYVEVLDGSRVHPETYEWARKMAVDALEYDDEDANPAGALEEILETPERLKDLDLDAFAVELERQGFGNKSITLYDIRSELNCRYKDLRTPYAPPSREEMFDMLTKETAETFHVGKMIFPTVTGIARKKPQGEQLDNANPDRNPETGLWQCPFCLKNDYPELAEVWNHFDAKTCPGQPFGVKLSLDNGLSGFIHLKNISDKHVTNPEDRVVIGNAIYCRVIKIDIDRYSVDCSSKTSDLSDRKNEWRPKKDNYYDQDAEDKDRRKEEDSKKQKTTAQYTNRIIVHPAFHNIPYQKALNLLTTMDQGEAIVRPSSKGTDHLTVTWKVANDIYQHIDVREEGKENVFSLGKSLWIGNEEFEDLDEIIARHIMPMAAYARDLLGYKYFRDCDGGSKEKLTELLMQERKKNASKIHYFFSACKHIPGQFFLAYFPRKKVMHEQVKVTPDGYRFRQQMFDSVNSLLKWFKDHYNEPPPSATPPVITPRGSVSNSSRASFATPALSQSSLSSNAAIQKVAKNLPSHMLHSLSQVANRTPHYPHTPGYGGQSSYVNTPYTPSGQTPFMTPYQTPHHSTQTPRYGQNTPNNFNNGQFAHPRGVAPGSRSNSRASNSYRPSPYQRSPHVPSPRSRNTPNNHGSSRPPPQHKSYEDEEAEWEQAAEAWESQHNTPKPYVSLNIKPSSCRWKILINGICGHIILQSKRGWYINCTNANLFRDRH